MKNLKLTILLIIGAITTNNAYATSCEVTEVSLGGFSATACSGYGDSGNPTVELNNLNAISAFNTPVYGTAIFQQIFRTDNAEVSANGSGSFTTLGSSLNLSITNMGINAGLNTFALSWSDPDLANAPNLPYYIDLVFSFKAGNNNPNSDAGIAYFFFDNFLLTNNPFSTEGEYNLIVNKDLSHNGLYARAGTQPDDEIPSIPEPSSVALLGVGLLGFAAQQLRKK